MTHDPQQRSAEDIRREIAATRDQLGDTVAALAEKADVKAQVKGRVEDVKSDVRDRVETVKEKIPGVSGDPQPKAIEWPPPEPFYRDPKFIGAILATGVVALWLIRRRA